MYLRDIPWKLVSQLLILDYDDGWEKLGAEIGFTSVDSQRLLFERNRGNSPTQEIITVWGYGDVTLLDLYHVLLKIDRVAEAELVEQFLKSNNLPIQEQPLNDFSSQRSSHLASKENSSSTCEQLKQINPNSLPRPSQRNLLQPNNYSHLPTEQPLFHKPLNTDGYNQNESFNMNKVTNNKGIERLPKVDFEGHNQNDSINVNKVSNHKDIDCTPKVALEEGAMADKPSSQSKNISSLIPFLELGCLYSYKEISCATNGFSDDNILGSGAFGSVYYGRLKETDCAIKKLTKNFSEVNDAISNLKKNALDELMIQLKFRHPNVVNLYGYSLDPDETCFVYEYMENGSLEDCLACAQNKSPLSWGERLTIAQGAACGLQYLHTQNVPVIHGDVKSSNILIDKHKEAKIGDFGLAMFATKGTDTGILTHVSKNMTGSLFGTVAYMPPEFPRSSGRQYLASDVYSFGVVLHEILTGQKAYDEKRLPKRFLMEYIDFMLESPDERVSHEDISTDVLSKLKDIIDPNAGACFEKIIMDLYLLATKSTHSKKKNRPCMLSIFEELKRINTQLNEMMCETEPHGNSLPLQLQQLYDERNQRSSSGVASESVEETQDENCYQLSMADVEKNIEDFSFSSNSCNNSNSLQLSTSDSLREVYKEKRLPASMDSFFSNYQNLTSYKSEEEDN